MDKVIPSYPFTFDLEHQGTLAAFETKIRTLLGSHRKGQEENKVKFSIFLSCINPQGREINSTLNFSQEEQNFDCNVILQKFENFYIPRQNLTLLTFKSLTRKQK